jgi:hypothetical protein
VAFPAVRVTRYGYVASTPPLPGKDRAERERDEAQGGHRFKKHSQMQKRKQLSQLKLDRGLRRRHTPTTMVSDARILELVPPLRAQLAALVMLIVVVILILPR